MRDIQIKLDGLDAGVQDTNLYKATNVADVQLGSLSYAPTFGVDKRFFMNSEFEISSSSYAAHVMEKLSQAGIPAMMAVKVASDFADALAVSVERTG